MIKKTFILTIGSMKKVLFLFMSLFCVMAANAQFKFTPTVGTTILKESAFKANFGVQAGIGVRYSFNKKDDGFGIQSGLYFIQRNSSSSGTALYMNDGSSQILIPETGDILLSPLGGTAGGDAYSITTHRNYLQLPVMAEWAKYITPDVRFHVAAGPYFAVGLGGKNKVSAISWDTNEHIQADETSWDPFKYNNYKRFDFGLSFQTGVEIKRVAILLNYNMNLLHRNQGTKENLVSIGVGYTF